MEIPTTKMSGTTRQLETVELHKVACSGYTTYMIKLDHERYGIQFIFIQDGYADALQQYRDLSREAD